MFMPHKKNRSPFFKQRGFDRKRKLADAMIGQSMNGEPIQHWMQGVAKLGQAFAGRKMNERLDQEEQQHRDDLHAKLAAAIQGKDLDEISGGLASIPGMEQSAVDLKIKSLSSTEDDKIFTDAKGRKRRADGSFLFEDMKSHDKDVLSEEALEQKQSIAKAGKTSITNQVGTGKKFGEEFGKSIAEDFVSRLGKAREAAMGIGTIHEGRKLLDAGAMTGKFADWNLEFGKALQAAGIDYNMDATSNTEAYMAAMGREVGSIIKMFGAGTGLSDADRQYAAKIAGSEITVSEEALRKILDINEKARRNVIQGFNRDAEAVMGSPYAESIPYSVMVEVPPEYAKPEEKQTTDDELLRILGVIK